MADLSSNMVEGFSPAIIPRCEPVHPRDAFPMDSERYDVDVNIQAAPLPPQQSAYYGVGRDSMHATPTMWRFTSLAIPEWLSVMGWPFQIPKVPSALVVSMPRGRQNALQERSNIDMPDQTTLGNLTSVQASGTFLPSLAKIAF